MSLSPSLPVVPVMNHAKATTTIRKPDMVCLGSGMTFGPRHFLFLLLYEHYNFIISGGILKNFSRTDLEGNGVHWLSRGWPLAEE